MENVKLILESSYNIKILHIEKIKNVYKLITTGGVKCFKLSRYKEYLVEFILDCIEHVNDNGFNGVLKPILSIDGKRYIKFLDGYGYLCDWVESREADFKNPVDLRLCTKALADFHLSSRDFDIEKEAVGRRYTGKWIKKFERKITQLEEFEKISDNKIIKTDFDKMYLSNIKMYKSLAVESVNLLENGSYLNVMKDHKVLKGICHHDTANHNFLINEDFDVYMIDFDYCIVDSHIHDLASILIRNMKYGNWNTYTMEYILKTYREKIDVSYDEMRSIRDFIMFPQDFWQVGLQYYIENQPWSEENFERRLQRCLDDGRIKYDFLHSIGEDFMKV